MEDKWTDYSLVTDAILEHILRQQAAGKVFDGFETDGDNHLWLKWREAPVIRVPLQRFVEAMERQLQKNDHKKGWDHLDLTWLVTKLAEEGGEVAALVVGDENGFSLEALIAEAADVANVAMMIYDIARQASEE